LLLLSSTIGTGLGEAEESAATARGLHALCEGLVASDLSVGDGTTSHAHGLLEVSLGELGHGVLLLDILVHSVAALSLPGLLLLDGQVNRLLDGQLDGTLSDEAKIGTGEAVSLGGNEANVNVRGDGSLAELGLENALTALLVGQGNVDKSVETTRTAQGVVKLLRPVGGTDNEDVLLAGHAVHLGKKLVNDTVGSTASITLGTATRLGDGVKLIEEDNARSGGASLVEDVADVALRLTEPHGEQFRALDGDEVGSALVGDGLGKKSLTSTGRTIEKHTLGGRHAKLEELLGVVDGVLHTLDEFPLDLLETSNVLPPDVGNLDNGDLAKGRRVADAKGELEVLLSDSKAVKNLGVDGVLIQIDQVHLLTNLLHGGLRAEGCNVGSDVTVGLGCDGLEVNILGELHVLGVNLKDLQAASGVGNTNVDLAIEATETTKGRVDGVGAVGGGHDHNVGAGLHAVHEGEKLGDDTPLDLTVGLVTLGRDRIDLVDEDDRRAVLLGLLEGLAQVRLGLSGHLGHDFGAVDEEEECTSLIGNSARHKSLTGTRRTVHEDTARRLDTDGLEKLRVPERQLDKLSDLSHLLPAASDIIVSDLVEVALLVFALDGLALAVDNCVLCNNAVLWGVHLDDLELDRPHGGPAGEGVALSERPVCLAEVGRKENVEERTSEALDGVGHGEDGHALGVLDVGTRVDGDDVTKLYAEVVPDHAVHADGAIIEVVVGEDDEHGVLSLLALDEDSVATEQLKGLHGVVGEGQDGVVIGGGVGDDQAVGLLLLFEDGGGDLIVVVLLAARVTGMMLAPCRQRWRWQTWRQGDKAHRRRAASGVECGVLTGSG
jgi:hypothetical protein